MILRLFNHLEEVLLATEHLARSSAIDHSQRRCVSFAVLDALIAIPLVSVRDLRVVSLEDSHEVERRDTLLFVGAHGSLHIFESAPARESLIMVVNLGVLVVDLHLVETLISHALRMHNEATLGIQVVVLLIVIVEAVFACLRADP